MKCLEFELLLLAIVVAAGTLLLLDRPIPAVLLALLPILLLPPLACD